MPSISGYATDEQKQQIEDLIDKGVYDSHSDFIQYAVRYTLDNKHGL